MILFLIITGTLIAGVGSVLIAGFLTFGFFSKFGDYLLSFATGTLLATAFLNLLPEAFKLTSDSTSLLIWLLVGLLLFFILNKADLYHHGHEHGSNIGDNEYKSFSNNKEDDSLGSWKILIIGDAVHAFGDGILIASAFVADIHLGILATISVLIHEIPHHIGDIAVVHQSTNSKSKSINRVLYAGIFAVFGGIAGFYLIELFEYTLPVLLVLASSSFIYVSLADLIPQLQKKLMIKEVIFQIFWLGSGILLIWLVSVFTHHHH